MLSYSAFRLTVTFHHCSKEKHLWSFLWSQIFILVIMLFDFESKESAECFVGYVSANEDFFHVQRKYNNFMNQDMQFTFVVSCIIILG